MNKCIIFMLSLVFTGCIGHMQWEHRVTKDKVKHWIPVCPNCKQVVDYNSLQCANPKCRILLTWSDKVIYAKKTYLEEKEMNKNSLKKQKNNTDNKQNKKEKKKAIKDNDRLKKEKTAIEADATNTKIKKNKKVVDTKKEVKKNNKQKNNEEWKFEEDDW